MTPFAPQVWAYLTREIGHTWVVIPVWWLVLLIVTNTIVLFVPDHAPIPITQEAFYKHQAEAYKKRLDSYRPWRIELSAQDYKRFSAIMGRAKNRFDMRLK